MSTASDPVSKPISKPIEEERDFLLKSLDDLEIEYTAGDLSDDDYETLKNDYTVRAADLIRQIAPTNPSETTDSPSKSSLPTRSLTRPLTRPVAVVLGLLVFAVGAGWLLAQAAGERGASDSLTGTVTESLREKNLACQEFMSRGELRNSLVCYDEVLTEDPQNVEALTYKGWFLILTSGSASEAGDESGAAEFLELGQASLADAVAVNPSFPDARAFRIVVFSRLGETEAACEELAILNSLNPSPAISGLIGPVADRLACE